MTTSPRPTSDERASEGISFDEALSLFTMRMHTVADWKNQYVGAAYSTRLQKAIEDARYACLQMEVALLDDKRRSDGAIAKAEAQS